MRRLKEAARRRFRLPAPEVPPRRRPAAVRMRPLPPTRLGGSTFSMIRYFSSVWCKTFQAARVSLDQQAVRQRLRPDRSARIWPVLSRNAARQALHPASSEAISFDTMPCQERHPIPPRQFQDTPARACGAKARPAGPHHGLIPKSRRWRLTHRLAPLDTRFSRPSRSRNTTFTRHCRQRQGCAQQEPGLRDTAGRLPFRLTKVMLSNPTDIVQLLTSIVPRNSPVDKPRPATHNNTNRRAIIPIERS